MPSLDLPLKTDRLTLRAHREDDAVPLQKFYSREDVALYLLGGPWTPEQAVESVAERLPRTGLETESGALAVVIDHDGLVIGDAALWLVDRERGVAEIGWVLDPEHGGQGFAAEAAEALLSVAFDTYRLHRVAAQMDARNTPSARLAERLGMRREAHLRQNWWSKGEWTDTLIFGMLADDRRTPSPYRQP